MKLQTRVLYEKDGTPIGFWFELDGEVRWQVPDPPDLISIGVWIAANEVNFEKSYRTARRDCGFAVVFNSWRDAEKMREWLNKPSRVSLVPEVVALLHRRRNKYQQLPGNGDRKWSARMGKDVLKKLRILGYSPFSSDEVGELYLPVTNLRAFQLNW